MTLDSSLPIIRRYTSIYIDLLLSAADCAPLNSSSEILTTARGHANQSRSVYARRRRRRRRPYDDDVDGMGRMRVTHFSEIISDSFLSFSLSAHTHQTGYSTRALDDRWCTASNTSNITSSGSEHTRALSQSVCVCDAVSIVFALMVRACALASIDLAELILILREK